MNDMMNKNKASVILFIIRRFSCMFENAFKVTHIKLAIYCEMSGDL